MSDDSQDKPLQADATGGDRVLTASTYAEMRKLNEFTLHGVRVIRHSNLGPITIHSTGRSDPDQPSQSLMNPQRSEEIMEKCLESLAAGKVATTPEE